MALRLAQTYTGIDHLNFIGTYLDIC